MTTEQAFELINYLKNNDKVAFEKLQNKSRWEQETMTSVIMSWGDPRNWD